MCIGLCCDDDTKTNLNYKCNKVKLLYKTYMEHITQLTLFTMFQVSSDKRTCLSKQKVEKIFGFGTNLISRVNPEDENSAKKKSLKLTSFLLLFKLMDINIIFYDVQNT